MTCTVDGCAKRARSKGSAHCEMHYYRLRRTGSLSVRRPKRESRGVCVIDGCGMTDAGPHGLCDKHWIRWKRHGDPGVVLKPLPVVGERNGNWTGEEATYEAAHQRLRKARGRAASHSCVDCGGPAQQWSYTRDDPNERTDESGDHAGMPFSLNVIDHYAPRCISCHKKFDLA